MRKILFCFFKLSSSFLKIREKDNLLCFRINKYIGKNIVEKKEKDEWMSLKKEFEKKYSNEIISDYYKGLFLLLYGKDHEIKKNYDILSKNNNITKSRVEDLINFLTIFEEIYNSNVEDVELKFQATIIYIVYKLKDIEYIESKFNKLEEDKSKSNIKEDEKNKINSEKAQIKKIRDLMKTLIAGLNGEE